MRTRAQEFRIALAAATWSQFAVVGNPSTSLLHSYHNTYSMWRVVGSDVQWECQLFAICVMGTLAAFNWPRAPMFRRALHLWAAVFQGLLLITEGLLFAATVPPQTGVFYIPLGIFILRWGWIEYRDGC